jgi:parallel beta-helix repeat protein
MLRRSSRFRPLLEVLEDRTLLATYYVAPSGSDGNTGLSDQAAWKTLQKAADVVQAGDLVIVRAGTYVGFDIRGKDGTAAQRITFKADPGVLINVRNNKTDDGINIEGVDYVTIDGFNVVGIGRTGIRSVTNTDVTIVNCNCDANGRWGILTGFSNNLLIQNNVCSNSVAEHGIYVSNSCVNPVVRGNRLFGNFACGLHMNGDLSMGGNGLVTGALVENNIIYNNGAGGGSAINGDGVQSSRIQNNILYNNHSSGISLYRIDGADGSKNNIVINNTVLVASDGRWALNIQNGSTGNKAYNNILWNYHSFRGAISISTDSLPGFQSNTNIVIGRFTLNGGSTILTLAQWQQQTGQDANSFTATPSQLFVNPTPGVDDYHLKAGSPAIGKGSNSSLAPKYDFEGTKRGRNWGLDIGADQYTSQRSG